ncbi:hypothetical protein COW98_00475 [Candidatus Roizmanbacteria bacterium CG22_combo_CG10-13_8_21_14_all_35_9]|uniref:Glycosyltransferase RgtA/B/C/D-like domain-containing protein n=4 Tax=Candidatus Roizmaniibacteriota TaxID=1752723 RepID=A0A2M8F4D4_9BACT|nr:MAG: hypothetical protein COX47_03025 [Candidatus Roizmanbacteria bacterium CG23_combo_of_CG06-09_8_20_14_all_35_49]PIP63087.1 MAG: hypothetical protein COW98_00475 [Candidatus Roizmanbacteria bacterium CG22_combo_CG10-13_8_21_14_all_35_9]PIY70915.1 MAG: hypothetical protein COY88_03095 [Candidatus Roizmanbacteria bacterium CG_4_10_14_0_8_um_filter_35_28]PJC34110.1 MAG: hypothetical protein CO048_01335 [Candidatus Roizmanbacteria bacterium CG_4_9_14_0_2_um_filter_35_15]PJC83179.1 MAG: hypoth
MSFFIVLFSTVLLFFHQAFKIKFFQDDYFFISISQPKNITDFLHFFSPIRTYSFKPLSSELFYFFLKLFNYNFFIGHLTVFITYFFGLYFLYQCVRIVSKNNLFAKLSVFLYAINLTHVFQLYWFATFQEILLFTALTASFYFYLKKKIPVSLVFFLIALLSKETAILFIPFLLLYDFVFNKKEITKKSYFLIYFLTAFYFYFIYRLSLTYVTENANYSINLTNLRMIINNAMWYLLWAVGMPNFVPNFMQSIFKPPLPIFQEYWKQTDFQIYSFLLLISWLILLVSFLILLVKKKNVIKSVFNWGLFCLISFYLYLGPILFFPHKWIVRLMLPQIFISVFFAYILWQLINAKGITKNLAIVYLVIYVLVSYFGVRLHQSSSLYFLENQIAEKATQYFQEHKKEILKYDAIFFRDLPLIREEIWGQSIKLKDSLMDEHFLSYFFPEKKLKAFYSFETKSPPKNSYLINSFLLLK